MIEDISLMEYLNIETLAPPHCMGLTNVNKHMLMDKCWDGRMSCREKQQQQTLNHRLRGLSAWAAVFGHYSKPKKPVPVTCCTSPYR